jgi:hypothetical protein
MKSSHTSFPFDRHRLVALESLTAFLIAPLVQCLPKDEIPGNQSG